MFVRHRATAVDINKKNKQLLQYTKSIEDAEDNLRKINLELVEANAAKEEYLGLFLSMCSGYLDKLKKTLPRDQYEAELKNFYKTFDTSFLQLYPTFVEEFNALLTEDCLIKVKEGELILKNVRPTDDLILLDEHGKEYSSVQLAKILQDKISYGCKDIVFVIGGAYGFSEAVYARADAKLSLSRMTFSHQMVRAIFVEQIYRAFTIIKGEPYHHE